MIKLIKNRANEGKGKLVRFCRVQPIFNMVKDIIFAWKYKRAVREAKKLSALFGMKYYVLSMGGRFKVVPKQNIRYLVRTHRFRKGVKIADIEKRALYVTT